jgi:hypothetical protein
MKKWWLIIFIPLALFGLWALLAFIGLAGGVGPAIQDIKDSFNPEIT